MKRSDGTAANVRRQYETWPFPGREFLSREGLLLVKCLSRWLSTRSEGRPARFIDVGCGTGHTTVALARHFPGHQFVGIDTSNTSLSLANRLREEHNVENVVFRRVDLQRKLPDLGTFRVVFCSGVLHHIKDLARTFRRVSSLVEPGGYLILWLYGHYGRMRHQLNQQFLTLLSNGVTQSQRLKIAETFTKRLGGKFVSGSGFYAPPGCGPEGLAWLISHPQWLADQMIPGFEQSVTMRDILRLFDGQNIRFTKWLGVPTSLRRYTNSRLLLERFARLSARERLLAIDLLRKPEYYFVVGRRGFER